MSAIENSFKFVGTKISHYASFLLWQVTHMRKNNYILFAISLLIQIWILLSQPITPISFLTFVGTTLGVACVIAINAARSINGLLGIASGICFMIVGYSAKNYLSIAEQISYICTLDIPVLISTDWNKNLASKIRKFTPLNWVEAIGFTALVAVISWGLIANLTNDPRPVYDAIAFSISLTGGLVCFLRFNNQYVWWLASGLAQALLWFITYKEGSASPSMLINSIIYITNDVLAFTISPWYNLKTRKAVAKQDAARA